MSGQSEQSAELSGDPPIPVVLRFSGRARRLSLRVSRLDGRVTLTVPRSVSRAQALAFAQERADWLRGHLARAPHPHEVGLGSQVPIEGVPTVIRAADLRRPVMQDGALLVPERAASVGPVVEGYLKLIARDRLARLTRDYAAQLDRKVTKLSLRDTRSRWGSCTARGGLMFSWRLAMAPPPVLDYVAAHEAAHLVEMNHSAAFWAVNARLCPDYQTHRAWLRTHGAELHRWRFRASVEGS